MPLKCRIRQLSAVKPSPVPSAQREDGKTMLHPPLPELRRIGNIGEQISIYIYRPSYIPGPDRQRYFIGILDALFRFFFLFRIKRNRAAEQYILHALP